MKKHKAESPEKNSLNEPDEQVGIQHFLDPSSSKNPPDFSTHISTDVLWEDPIKFISDEEFSHQKGAGNEGLVTTKTALDDVFSELMIVFNKFEQDVVKMTTPYQGQFTLNPNNLLNCLRKKLSLIQKKREVRRSARDVIDNFSETLTYLDKHLAMNSFNLMLCEYS